MNIDELVFRSHSVGDLMGAKGLGATGEKRAIQTYIEAKTNRTKEIKSKYLEKGIENEQEAIDLVNRVFCLNLEKNQARMTNEYLTGECDCIDSDYIVDIKNSWDIFTFNESKSEQNKNYLWQGVAYMELYNKPRFNLVYCLTDAPDSMVLNELEKASYRYGGELPDIIGYQIIFNMIFDQDHFRQFIEMQGQISTNSKQAIYMQNRFVHIPELDRVHCVQFDRSDTQYQQLTSRIKQAREFLKTIYN